MLSHLKCTSRCLKVTGSVHSVHRGLADQTHYEVLQIPRSATAEQIKNAYIKRCKQVHPDRNKLTKESNDNFTRLHEAYQILIKPKDKLEYDRKLNMGINITESYDPSPPPPPQPKPDDRIYKNYQQSYYGATREERAQKERDFYRRQQRRQEETEMGWVQDPQTNKLLFNILIVSVIILVGVIANFWLKHSANKTMRERAVKAREAMEAGNGSKYPRARRKYLRTDFELRMEEMERRKNR